MGERECSSISSRQGAQNIYCMLAGSLAFRAMDALSTAPSSGWTGQAWVVATTAGSLHVVHGIDEQTWQILEAVQHAMAEHSETRFSLQTGRHCRAGEF